MTPDKSDAVFRAWCGAWLDTEGSIGLYRLHRLRNSPLFSYTVKVTIAQVDMEPLNMIREAFGGFVKRGARHTSRHKYIYNLVIQNRQALEMLEAVREYVIVKTAQLDLALDAGRLQATFKNRPTLSAHRLNAIKERLHRLNGWSKKRRAAFSVAIRRNKVTKRVRWALRYDQCIACGGTDQPHASFGRCHKCWSAQYYRENKDKLQKKRRTHL